MQFAYLDAGAGSLIASAVVGGAAAAGVAVRSARSRMAGALGRKRKGEGEDEGVDLPAGEPAGAEVADDDAGPTPGA